MSPDRSVAVHVPRSALWIFGLLIAAPWIAVGIWFFRSTRSAGVTPRPAAMVVRTGAPGDVIDGRPGPWGHIEYSRILIEPPEEFILTDYTRVDIRPWVFKGYTEASLAELWNSAGLTNRQRKFLSDPANRETRDGAILVHPNRELIVSLSAASRTRIYSALGEFAENVPQYNPFRLRASVAVDWLDHTNLPEEAIALTKKMYYPRGTATCFSDDSIVLGTLPSAEQRVRYIKALSRKAALLVELQVEPGQDVEPLAAYWGRGGRTKDLRPLLQSLARRPNGGSIDIVHLVPRFVRLLVYTYPLPSEKPIDANHDCHWTSFNFQNDEPDERFSNIDYVRQVLLDQYYPVMGQPLLGDIIMFVRQDGVVVHSCVYIADDIVFTKNGPAYSVPWVFASLADVQAFYASNPGVEMRRYRAKNL